MKVEQISIPAKDNYPLTASLFHPDGDCKTIVQIHSGTGIPQKLYAHFAAFLASNGITAISFDYRGVAESAPDTLKGFQAEVLDWGKLDMTGVFDWVIENYPEHKKIIVGHSMGGQLVGLMENHKFIDQLFLIASSTGYWRDMSSPYKWLPAFFWYFLIPLQLRVYGYVNAMKVRQGENLPKGVAQQWREWCLRPDYFEPDLEDKMQPHYFNDIDIPIKAIRVSDDPLANDITSSKLLKYYGNAQIEVEVLEPEAYELDKIGHTGFFSRKMKSRWVQFLDEV